MVARALSSARDGDAVELANELRLPRGRTAHLTLSSDNVIHAFWVPSLAGKIDMIPGRTTYLTLEPNRTGTFRGLCAEYCGTSHARMAFEVLVLEPAEFEAWLDQQAAPAAPATPEAQAGARGLHRERLRRRAMPSAAPTPPVRIGPDLTHVGSRAPPRRRHPAERRSGTWRRGSASRRTSSPAR